MKSESVSHSVISDSLQPYGLETARLLCPRDSSGKNVGMFSHFCLQRMFPSQGSNQGLLHWGRSITVWATREDLFSRQLSISCVLTWWKGWEIFLGLFYIRTLIHSHDLITSQKPYLLIPSHWQLGFQYMNWIETTIQFITPPVYIFFPCYHL